MHPNHGATVEVTATIEGFLNQLVSQLAQAIELKVIGAMADLNNKSCHCHKTSENSPEFLTKKQALNILKISAPTLLRYQKEGLIPYYRVGRKVYFKTSEIADATKVTLKHSKHRKEARNDR